jgi:RNA polymerase sigma-B factor
MVVIRVVATTPVRQSAAPRHRASRAAETAQGPPSPTHDDRSELTASLFAKAGKARSKAERKRLEDEIVMLNMQVAESLAARYRNRGVPDDDLFQVAYLGLVKAVRGFDLDRAEDFLSYAVPTVRGEIKRHFRDRCWGVRIPRRLQELQARITVAAGQLTQELNRSPRPTELAEYLGEPLEDVTEALAADGCFTPASLDVTVGTGDDTSFGALFGEEDPAYLAAEARVALGPALQRLAPRDRHIVRLRFVEGWTQQQIADDIGVTQMQVSRLLARILADLRGQLE